MSDNITTLPVKKKPEGPAISLVSPFQSACAHRHVIVDRALNELACRDCKERLNPIEYIARVAEGIAGWEYERQRIIDARGQFEERKKCRCTKCGEMTEIRRVSNRELKNIKGS